MMTESSRLDPKDELEIRNLVARLGHLADMADDLDEYLACFTEDAVWEFEGKVEGLPPATTVGRDAIAADRRMRRADRFQGPGTETRHMNTTLAVRGSGEGIAEADSYWLFVGAGEEGPNVRGMGHYHDQFRLTETGWKLCHRRIVTG